MMNERGSHISEVLKKRMLVMDGAMGTMLQQFANREEQFATGELAAWRVPLKGNYDLLNLTRPHLVRHIHQQYVDAGADIITTNTINSNCMAQSAFLCEGYARRMALEGAKIAKSVAQAQAKPVWVAGSVGPMNRGISSAVEKQEEMTAQYVEAYAEQVHALVEGGVDVILVETCYDVLNCKAALTAIQSLNHEVPVMVTATVNPATGRMLCGHTIEEFYAEISNYQILAIGLNCMQANEQSIPWIKALAGTGKPIIFCPNAGFPNHRGEYPDSPHQIAAFMHRLASHHLIHIAGGCCGTTPAHIRATSTPA